MAHAVGSKKEQGSGTKKPPRRPRAPDEPRRPGRQPDYQRPRTESGDLDEEDAAVETQRDHGRR